MTAPRPTAAFAKIGRARQHALELRARIIGWLSVADPHPVGSIADDRLSWEIRLSEFVPPPLEEWALTFGDSVHNLRSALDVLVWGYVDEDALTDGQQRSIAFPAWVDPDRWDSDSKRLLRTVPADIVERVRECQPFKRPESERATDGLLLLTELDNQDKHRLTITPVVQLRGMQFEHSVEFHDEYAAARNVPPDNTVHETALIPGELLLSGRTKDPIAKVRGTGTVQVQFGLDPGNGFVGVVEILDAMTEYTVQIVTYVWTGDSPARATPDGAPPAGA